MTLIIAIGCQTSWGLEYLPSEMQGSLGDVGTFGNFSIYEEPDMSSKKIAAVINNALIDESGKEICQMIWGNSKGACSNFFNVGWYNFDCDATWFLPYFDTNESGGQKWYKVKTVDFEGWVTLERVPNATSLEYVLRKFSGGLGFTSPLNEIYAYKHPIENPRLLSDELKNMSVNEMKISVLDFEEVAGRPFMKIYMSSGDSGSNALNAPWIPVYSKEQIPNLWLKQGCH